MSEKSLAGIAIASLLLNLVLCGASHVQVKRFQAKPGELDQLVEDVQLLREEFTRLQNAFGNKKGEFFDKLAGMDEARWSYVVGAKQFAESIEPPELPFNCGSPSLPCSKEFYFKYAENLTEYVTEHGALYEAIEDLYDRAQALAQRISELEGRISGG